jgi:RNA polymerase sigma-70 factor (ECF subfamily)
MSDDGAYIQFLAEARSGSQAGMGRLAVLVWERLYPFVFRTTLDRDTTEDVIQETLLAMLHRIQSLRDSARFWPWIYQIAWRKIQDRVRDRRLQVSFLTARRRRRSDMEEGRAADANPLEAQVRAEVLEQISAAIDRLNHRQRDILRLRCYDQLAYTEIATLTRMTPEKARVHFHRAKKSLKKHLACHT